MTNTRKALELGALLALLVPKCPLCVAAWLAAYGMSAGVASVTASLARPALLVLATLTLAGLAVTAWRRRHWRAAANCCAARDPDRPVMPL